MTTPTILCATDLGPDGARALEVAAGFARAVGGRVILVHATDANVECDTSAVPESMGDAKKALEARLRARLAEEAGALERERQRCESLGVAPCESVLADGRPADALERLAREKGAALVVLGRRERRSGFVGPTVHHVVRHVGCPVVVAPPAGAAPSDVSTGRWLVGVDFSRPSRAALSAARALVGEDGEIVIANVVAPTGEEDLPYELRMPARILREESNAEAARQLDAVALETGPICSAVQRSTIDPVADELIATAEEMGATGIAVGTHGRTGIGRFLLGDTADLLLRHARCPVLVVREAPPSVESWFEPPDAAFGAASAKHMLVAVDFSDASRRALETARELSVQLGAAVEVVYVHEPPTDVRHGLVARLSAPEAEPPHADEQTLRKAKEQLDLLVRDVFTTDAGGVATEVVVGRPVERILVAAGARNADLIVVGTTGRSGIERMLLGSVAEALVRTSRVPVLTVR
jgi:nucleotide-binding universal stress UspA family protein